MPESLHAELARVADQDGVSLNQFITSALASAVGWRRAGLPASADGAGAEVQQASRRRSLNVLLAANLVVIVIVALVAVGLLVAAWLQG